MRSVNIYFILNTMILQTLLSGYCTYTINRIKRVRCYIRTYLRSVIWGIFIYVNNNELFLSYFVS